MTRLDDISLRNCCLCWVSLRCLYKDYGVYNYS